MITEVSLLLITVLLGVLFVLLAFCFTESKGKNTPHARKQASERPEQAETQKR